MPDPAGHQESLFEPAFDASVHPMLAGSAAYAGPDEPGRAGRATSPAQLEPVVQR